MIFFAYSNVLLYAIDQDSPDKRQVAHEILARGRHLDMVLSSQVLGEFLSVVKRKQPARLDYGIELVTKWSLLFPVIWTSPDHILTGARIVSRYQLQFWDSVILAVASDQGASLLLTEDMQDGSQIENVRILNPFAASNRSQLDDVLQR